MDNNCWYLFGTRIKSGAFKKDVHLFTDNSAERTWKVLSSDDEAETDGKESRSETKKLKLATGRRSAGKELVETAKAKSDDDDSSSDEESFLERDNLVEENKAVFGSSSSWHASTSTLVHNDVLEQSSSNEPLKSKDFNIFEGKSSESSGAVKKRFVLKKTK